MSEAVAPPAMANVRDADWFACPRHDSATGSSRGHAPGAWSPKFHVKIDHPTKGGSWSACGIAFLIGEYDSALEDIPDSRRCKRSGCRERWPGGS